MYTGKLDMFHNRRNKCMIAVADRICLTLGCMAQETVDQDRAIRCHTFCCFHIDSQIFRIVYHFHATSAQYIGRTNHNRITDLFCNRKCLIHIHCHTCFRHRNTQFVHHRTEQISVFCHIDDFRRSTKDLHPVFFQICRQIQRCLATELCDHTKRLFLLINRQYIFQCQRLKIQFIGSIIVGRYGFRVTVYDDRLKTCFFQSHRRMYTAIVKFDTLTDTVRTAAEDHDLILVIADRTFVFAVIGGVIVSIIFRSAYMNTFPRFFHALCDSRIADVFFRNSQDLSQIFVRETVQFCLFQGFRSRHLTFVCQKCFLFFHQFFHLFDEVVFDLCQRKQFVHRCTFSQCFIHDKLSLAVRFYQHL